MKYFNRYIKIAPFSHAVWRSLEAEAIDEIKLKRPILDIGCGFGEFAGVFFKTKVEMGIDISKKDLIEAAKRKKYKKLILADARNLPFKKNFFNTVISISTLEHIENFEKVFREVWRILKPKGLFVFTIPTSKLNEELLIARFFKKIKLNLFADFYLKLIHWSFKHRSIYSKNRLIKLIEKKSFKIIKIKPTISQSGVWLWEMGLPLALPSQLTRILLKKRVVFSPKIRLIILNKIRKKFLKKEPLSEANLLIVCQKQ